ncbi:hypothetical protein ACQZ4R_20765 [Agrobacterium vitis]
MKSLIKSLAENYLPYFQHKRNLCNRAVAGAYRGRPEDIKRNDAIMAMLKRGQTWDSIRNATGCSNSTIARLAKRVKMAEERG